jgi:hypothetical protein
MSPPAVRHELGGLSSRPCCNGRAGRHIRALTPRFSFSPAWIALRLRGSLAAYGRGDWRACRHHRPVLAITAEPRLRALGGGLHGSGNAQRWSIAASAADSSSNVVLWLSSSGVSCCPLSLGRPSWQRFQRADFSSRCFSDSPAMTLFLVCEGAADQSAVAIASWNTRRRRGSCSCLFFIDGRSADRLDIEACRAFARPGSVLHRSPLARSRRLDQRLWICRNVTMESPRALLSEIDPRPPVGQPDDPCRSCNPT